MSPGLDPPPTAEQHATAARLRGTSVLDAHRADGAIFVYAESSARTLRWLVATDGSIVDAALL